jgi:tetratricopeptide (TPR) repeat protein
LIQITECVVKADKNIKMVSRWAIVAIFVGALSTEAAEVSRAQDDEAFSRKCYDNGRSEQVIAGCTAVISRGLVDKEDLATAYKNRGNAYDDKGQYGEALEDYGRAVAINPQDADAFNSRGATYTALRRYDLAVRDFDRAIELNPSSPMALGNRCFARAASGELEQALADCNEALRVRPGFPGAYASRAFVYLKLKRYDAAIADYSSELRTQPDDPYSLFGRGTARHIKGDLRMGDADIVAAEAIKPDIADHMARLGIGLKELQ